MLYTYRKDIFVDYTSIRCYGHRKGPSSVQQCGTLSPPFSFGRCRLRDKVNVIWPPGASSARPPAPTFLSPICSSSNDELFFSRRKRAPTNRKRRRRFFIVRIRRRGTIYSSLDRFLFFVVRFLFEFLPCFSSFAIYIDYVFIGRVRK